MRLEQTNPIPGDRNGEMRIGKTNPIRSRAIASTWPSVRHRRSPSMAIGIHRVGPGRRLDGKDSRQPHYQLSGITGSERLGSVAAIEAARWLIRFFVPSLLLERYSAGPFFECLEVFRILLVIFLMIIFRWPKFHCRQNFGNNRFIESSGGRHLSF